MAILITGCARSGTSLTAGIIDICGAFGGITSGPNSNNKKGMFENNNIRQNMVKGYLRSIEADPMGQNPLPDTENIPLVPDWKEQVMNVFTSQEYRKGPWYYKGAKMPLMWPVWHDAFPDAKWVLVRRTEKEIAKSCLNTGFMRAYTDIEGWIGWVREHERRFVQMKKAGLDIIEIWPNDLMKGNLQPAVAMIAWLGLTWKDAQIKEFLEPSYWSTNNV